MVTFQEFFGSAIGLIIDGYPAMVRSSFESPEVFFAGPARPPLGGLTGRFRWYDQSSSSSDSSSESSSSMRSSMSSSSN